MGFTDTVKKMFGKGKDKGKKSGKKNFYLESEQKKPSRDTYDMSGMEGIGEMPDRNPNGPNNSGPDSKNPQSPNQLRNNPQSGKGGMDNAPKSPQRGNKNIDRSTRSRQPHSQNRSKNNSNMPQMPGSSSQKGNIPDLDRSPVDNLDNSNDQMGRDDINRIMDKLDDIENRLRSVERRVKRGQ